jgi:hypothetical protein
VGDLEEIKQERNGIVSHVCASETLAGGFTVTVSECTPNSLTYYSFAMQPVIGQIILHISW